MRIQADLLYMCGEVLELFDKTVVHLVRNPSTLSSMCTLITNKYSDKYAKSPEFSNHDASRAENLRINCRN